MTQAGVDGPEGGAPALPHPSLSGFIWEGIRRGQGEGGMEAQRSSHLGWGLGGLLT